MMMENPFPGLRPFEAEEGHLFFGREQATDELLKKLRENRFIAVVGTSGSGKSSLVRAGMLPDLYGGFMAGAGSRWRVAILRPGDAPIRALAEALAAPAVLGVDEDGTDMQRSITEAVLRRGAFGLIEVARQARLAKGENLLVLVDQFEELFRIQSSSGRSGADEGAAFVKLLLEAATQQDLPIYVMLTMRSEYLGDCTRFRDLPEAINAGQYLVPRMTRDQARKAITGPIAVVGAEISSPLVQRLLNDVGDNPDQLPIMQHAMMRTFSFWQTDHAEGEEIGLSHYRATGGMDAALSLHADEAYDELSDSRSKVVAERIFKRLTGRGFGDREMRYPTTVAELCAVCGASQRRVTAVIEAFRRPDRSLLMPPPEKPLNAETIVDISHESLIRIWKRLRAWVEEEALSARHYTRLAETSELYGRKETSLWRDPELGLALKWREDNEPNQTWSRRYHGGYTEAMAFLDASKSAAFRRKMMVVVPAVLLPLVGGIYMANITINMVKEQLADAWGQKEEYRLALEQVQEQAQSEQELVDKVTEQATKITELQTTAEVIETMEAGLQRQIEAQLQLLRQMEEGDGSEAEKARILQTLTDLSDRASAVQGVAREQKERIEEVIVEPADQLTELAGKGAEPGLATESPSADRQPQPSEQPGDGTKTEVAALEDTEAATANTTEVTSADSANQPSTDTGSVVDGKATAGDESEPVVVAGAGAVAVRPDTESIAGETALVGQPEACADARDGAGKLPNRVLLEKWTVCADNLDEGEAKVAAQEELARLLGDLESYASVTADENFLTCTGVTGLNCRGASGEFAPGRIYVYARVHAPADASLPLDWYRQGSSDSPFRSGKLRVKQNIGRGFRTFTWKSVTEPGDYVVKLYNEQRQLIAQRDFTVR